VRNRQDGETGWRQLRSACGGNLEIKRPPKN